MGWRAMEEADMAAVTAVSDAVHGDYTEPLAVYAERQGCSPPAASSSTGGRAWRAI
jgi:hypothetical protein